MNPSRLPFDRSDAQAVYDLATSTDSPRLAQKVTKALEIIQESISRYGSVTSHHRFLSFVLQIKPVLPESVGLAHYKPLTHTSS